MIKTIEFSGKTEDEAIELALEQLNLSRDDISVEIVERAKTGFLGIKNTPAIIKVQYEAKDDRASSVKTFLEGLFEKMDVKAEISITETEDSIGVDLDCGDPGALIGRRGETLDAVQNLTNYVINRGSSSRIRINLDAENYRKRRNDTLESLAVRTAEKVVKYRRNLTLDSMNAYERHIIHATLQENDHISTFSVGAEPNRRVVVAYGRSSSSNRGDNGGRSNNSGRHRTNRDNAAKRSTVERDTVKAADNNSPPQTETDTTDTQYREWS